MDDDSPNDANYGVPLRASVLNAVSRIWHRGNVKKTTRYARAPAVTLAAAVAVGTPLTAAAAYNPAPWTALLLPTPVGYDPATSDICPTGSVTCVERTIAKLGNRLDPLVARCDHNLIFNFFYYRSTQAYRRVVEDSDYFRSNAYHNQLDPTPQAATSINARLGRTAIWPGSPRAGGKPSGPPTPGP